MADVVYFDSGINLPFCPPTISGLYISGSGCCSDFYTAFIGGNQTYNLTYTLPTSSGTSGQVLTNDGNGNLSWQTFGGGVGYPGGNNGMIQYNDNGVFGGSTLLYWNDLNNRLGFNTTNPQQSVDIQGTLRLSGSFGTGTNLMGRNNDGDVSNISLGSGLSLSSGTLSVTGSTGGGSGTVSGTGTTNYLSKWSSASGLTDSIIIQTGSNVDIRGTLRVTGSTGTPSFVVGRDGDGNISNLTIGSGLGISGGQLFATGGATGTTSGTGSTNQVAYWTGSNSIAGENNLWWNSTSDRLGVGTNDPQQTLHVAGNMRLTGSNGTANSIMGRDGNFDVSSISIGSGLSLSGNTLTASGITDGDKGDITVSVGGTVWTIDNSAVTNAKIAAGVDAVKIADGTVDNTEFQYLNGVTSNIQNQLNTKVTGTGTTDYVTKWSSASGLTDSIIIQTGSNVDIRGTLRVTGSTGTGTTLMARDTNFDVSAISVGTGLSLSGNTLSVTGSTGGVTGNYVPYIGATGNTNLGGYGIEGSYFQLNTATGGTLVPGMFSWNGTEGTADLMLKGGNVTLQLGQEQLMRVRNETGADLLEAQYKAVRVSGASGNRLTVVSAIASGETTSAETIGIVTETIANNQEGFITTNGMVRGIDTTGALQGETWADGDMLFLSPSTPGGLTNIKPQAPNHLVIVGYVVNSANNGSIFVKIDNGYELNELHNVLISSSVTNNDLLVYDNATKVWRNRTLNNLSITTGSGITDSITKWSSASGLTSSIIYQTGTNVDIRGTLRVTGSTGTGTTLMARDGNFDVSAITVGSGLSLSNNTLTTTGSTGVSGSGTATQVAFFSGATGTTSTTLTSSSGLTWDNVNGRLGIGTSNPTARVQINGVGTSSGTSSLFIRNSTSDIFGILDDGSAIMYSSAKFMIQNLSSSAVRLIGPSSSLSNRPALFFYPESSSADAGNIFGFIPKGSGFSATLKTQFTLYNTDFIADSANQEGLLVRAAGTSYILAASASGTGQRRPILLSALDLVSNQFWLFTDGNVGINTSSATARLHIKGSSTTNTNNTFLLENSGSTQLFRVDDGGGVKIGTGTNDSSAILQADSTTRGILPPRMSTTNKVGISLPAEGLVVYDNTMKALSVYTGANWATVGGGEQVFTITGTTATINFNSGNIADVTLASSTTLSLSGGTFGTFIIKLTQDAVGGRTVTWPSVVRWSGGIPPTMTTSPSKTDIITLFFDGTTYYGTYALNF